MRHRKLLLRALTAAMISSPAVASAVDVSVEMNTVSTTMSLSELETGNRIETGTPSNKIYRFTAEPGKYLLTGYATNGSTVNGTIVLDIPESDNVQFKVLTCTAYATNKNWTADTDYSLKVEVMDRNGVTLDTSVGNSSTAGRMTFLALSGCSYFASFEPSKKWVDDGYMTLYKSGTLTNNATVSGAIPVGADYSISIPEGAELYMGIKFTHFTKFREVIPTSVKNKSGETVYNYRLANGQVYNYRTWIKDGVTRAGYFTMTTDETKLPEINFTSEDYAICSPDLINQSPESNDGYETGSIFLNINPEGHLRLKKGDSFIAHAMRSWELTDNTVNNYFIEPDFHYTVLNLDGTPSEGIIEIENPDTTTDPWSRIKAVEKGTVVVLVTYDAIGLNYYTGATRKPYIGGEIWGGIWPENTGVFIVSVDEEETDIDSGMYINEKYNSTNNSKLSGNYIDSECDILYYFDGSPGAEYTFTPTGVTEVTLARPIVYSDHVEYDGFSNDGVTENRDGSYTVNLTEGRNIVRLTDSEGNSEYQIITAKECEMSVINVSDPEKGFVAPGDKVTVQFNGLYHPANKLAGIYNMSAYVTFNGVPNGTSLILGANQYKFASTPSAQAVTFEIPEDYDIEKNPNWIMTDGTIQISGYGDPIGSHRNISSVAGRSPNFTAIAHKTYLGHIPDVKIPVSLTGEETGIANASESITIISIYGLDGTSRRHLEPGLNIIRYSDGSTRKMII